MDKLKDIEIFLLDMDGTIYHENELIPGALDFFHLLQDQGKKYVFDMNNIATNGLLMKNRILFLGEDPQIVMNFAEAVALEKIEICIEIEDRILAEDVAYIQSQID